jgi:RING-type zinc-finger/MYND finger
MPKCSHCNEEKSRAEFSTKQLKKPSHERRCAACTARAGNSAPFLPSTIASTAAAHSTPTGTATQPHPIGSGLTHQHVELMHSLLAVLLSPNRKSRLPRYLSEQSDEAFSDYLVHVLFSRDIFVIMKWLVIPLIDGLIHGHDRINGNATCPYIGPSGATWPILFWLCQWKLLERQFGWQGGDTMVAIVLSTPGINVNQVIENKTNAGFFAVKYGSVQTLRILAIKGINMQHRDFRNRTLLYNALELPNPEMLRIILDNNVPAHEIFIASESLETGKFHIQSTADRLLNLFVENMRTIMDSGEVAPGLLSWINLKTRPSTKDVVSSLILVLQYGSSFTKGGATPLFKFMGHVFQGQEHVEEHLRIPDEFKRVCESLLGLWYPASIRAEIRAFDEQRERELQQHQEDELIECPICLSSFDKKTTLYCGHSFCRKCIIGQGSMPRDRGLAATCPICRAALCKDLCPPTSRREVNESSESATFLTGNCMGNLDSNILFSYVQQLMHLSELTDDQVMEEAKAQSFYTDSFPIQDLREKLHTRVQQGHLNAKKEEEFTFTSRSSAEGGNNPQQTLQNAKTLVMIELSSTHSICSGDHTFIAPKDGPVILQISVKGVPVLAHISNNSRYTIISKSVADNLCLKRIEKLQTKKFREGLSGKRMPNFRFTCLEKFSFSIGGIDVTLRNAVEISPDPDMNAIGIQLGQDFFYSARYCVVDTAVGNSDNESPRYMRTDGGMSWIASDCDSESLRYYSHDGKSCRLPIFHFNPNVTGRFNAMSLKWDASFTECNWCSRIFPEGMHSCAVCYEKAGVDAYYCDESCQKAAWKIHKATHVAHDGNG